MGDLVFVFLLFVKLAFLWTNMFMNYSLFSSSYICSSIWIDRVFFHYWTMGVQSCEWSITRNFEPIALVDTSACDEIAFMLRNMHYPPSYPVLPSLTIPIVTFNHTCNRTLDFCCTPKHPEYLRSFVSLSHYTTLDTNQFNANPKVLSS
jgi:hypothetical protein